MTIRRYSTFDKTKDKSLFKKSWNFLPLFLFKKQIDNFGTEFTKIFNVDYTDKLMTERHRIISINKMLQLGNLYTALYNIMIAKTQNDILKGDVFKNGESLKYYIEEVNRITGIKIESSFDLVKLEKEIQRRKDKYEENYSNNEEPEVMPFTQVAMSVFSVMEMDYNENMTLSELAELRILAHEKIKKIENVRNKRNNK